MRWRALCQKQTWNALTCWCWWTPEKCVLDCHCSLSSWVFWLNLLYEIGTEKTNIPKLPTTSPTSETLSPCTATRLTAQAQTCGPPWGEASCHNYLFRADSKTLWKEGEGSRAGFSPTTSDFIQCPTGIITTRPLGWPQRGQSASWTRVTGVPAIQTEQSLQSCVCTVAWVRKGQVEVETIHQQVLSKNWEKRRQFKTLPTRNVQRKAAFLSLEATIQVHWAVKSL